MNGEPIHIQEYKIVKLSTGAETFFFAHSDHSARYHAQKYIERNKGKFPMAVYQRTTKPKPFPLWEKINEP